MRSESLNPGPKFEQIRRVKNKGSKAHQHLDLSVGLSGVGPLSQGHDLPEQDPERPDVGLGGVDPVEQGLRGHPSKGEHPALSPVVVVLVDVPRQPKVPDLDLEVE